VATNRPNEIPTKTPATTELARETPIRDTLLNRIWTIVVETFSHPRTGSVLHLDLSDKVGSEPAKPGINKLDISPHFKLVCVTIAALTSLCLFLGMVATLRFPDPPAIQTADYCFELATIGVVAILGLLGGKAL
jgi:hypothetical protein